MCCQTKDSDAPIAAMSRRRSTSPRTETPNHGSFTSARKLRVQLSLFSPREMADPAMPEGRYFCAKCGRDAAPDPGQPAIDPRFAIGRCSTCSDPGTITKRARPMDHLIREDHFDREKWEEGREREEMRKLVHRFMETQGRTQPPKAIHRMLELVDKYGMPGFLVTSGMRTIAAQYEPPKVKGNKRGRTGA